MNKILFFLTALLFSTSVYSQTPNSSTPPNILWIVSEDNSPLLGCYGDTFATTPVLDQMAAEGVLYENALATAPVCAPARSTLITGVYPTSMGTQHMRSNNAIPDFITFFPKYLREQGYYCTNNHKEDYNIANYENVWDESSQQATYKNRPDGQPFFAIFNLTISHESSLHQPLDSLIHDPEQVPIPPYHPRTPEMKHDWAQYYDKVTMMDTQVGEILQELEAQGLADNTIVFYYSDHGGVLGRSKRFMYESGLHIPLIIRFPEKYRHLAPGAPGTRTDRIVTFVDFAPTMLSLTGVDVPDYMQGKAFLGAQQQPEREYGYCFRGRMDEMYDLSRSTRDKQYFYTRNYMPHRIYGQYLQYLWRAPSMASWEEAYQNGELNEAQSAFWETKPPEELYDVKQDPDNVRNLATDPQYQSVLSKMRKANANWVRETHDSGFLPEAEMIARAQEKRMTIYELVRQPDLPLDQIIATAEMASLGQPDNLPKLIRALDNPESGIRYWAATGCVILGKKAAPAQETLLKLLDDPSPDVVVASAEALYQLGEKQRSVAALVKTLQSDREMARVRALGVLSTLGEDARPALAPAKAIIANTPDEKVTHNSGYDVRAAQHLINNLN